MDKHTCEGIVITCIDFRFQDFIDSWIKENLGVKNHDRVAFAGGVKNLETVLGQIDISKRLHDIKKAILINHEDCGAYGEEGTFEKHTQDLQKAKEILKNKYPDLEVETYYLQLNGSFKEI